jgi:hypothetical protein
MSVNPASYTEDGVWITDKDLIGKLAARGYELWHPHDYICSMYVLLSSVTCRSSLTTRR